MIIVGDEYRLSHVCLYKIREAWYKYIHPTKKEPNLWLTYIIVLEQG